MRACGVYHSSPDGDVVEVDRAISQHASDHLCGDPARRKVESEHLIASRKLIDPAGPVWRPDGRIARETWNLRFRIRIEANVKRVGLAADPLDVAVERGPFRLEGIAVFD